MKKILPRISHSAASDWKTCGDINYFKRTLKVRPKFQGASLGFGTAIDGAIMGLLEAKRDDKPIPSLEELIKRFDELWDPYYSNNLNRYTARDYEAFFVDQEPELVGEWEKELKVTLEDALKAEKQSKYKRFSGSNLELYNRACWLSIKYKARLMIEAFLTEIFPKIGEVIAVQHKIEGEVKGVASIVGYIDLICMYQGFDKPIVFDLKTAASPYDEDKVVRSEQLLLYTKAVGEELGTDFAGFIILLKAIEKVGICSACGMKKESSHKTCNNVIKDKRCGAPWTLTPKANVQVLTGQLSAAKQDRFFESFTNIAVMANSGLRYKNYDNCRKYGLCDYYSICHSNDMSGFNFKDPEGKRILEEELKNE